MRDLFDIVTVIFGEFSIPKNPSNKKEYKNSYNNFPTIQHFLRLLSALFVSN